MAWPVCAEPTAALLIDQWGRVDDSSALRSSDCRTVYYFTEVYAIDPDMSSVLANQTEAGEPLIDINIRLVPNQETNPAHVLAWAGDKRPADCADVSQMALPYPSIMQSVGFDSDLGNPAVPLLQASYSAANSKTVHIQILPGKTSVQAVVRKLNSLHPELTFEAYEQVNDAVVEISANYAASSAFAQKVYNEQVCSEHEKCLEVMGVKINCHPESSCEDHPVLVQFLTNLNYDTGIEIKVTPGPNPDPAKIDMLREQLLLAMVKSLYVDSSRQAIGDVAQLTPGVMNKGIYSRPYHDVATDSHIAAVPWGVPVYFPPLGDFVAKRLLQIENSKHVFGKI